MTMMQPVIIYHNPACGTSRAVLTLIREAGVEPHIIEYLKTPLGTKLCRPPETVRTLLVTHK